MNVFDFVETFQNLEVPNEIKLGKVDPNYSSGRPRVIYDSDIAAGTLSKPLPRLASYTPTANDRVLIIRGVIIGKIV